MSSDPEPSLEEDPLLLEMEKSMGEVLEDLDDDAHANDDTHADGDGDDDLEKGDGRGAIEKDKADSGHQGLCSGPPPTKKAKVDEAIEVIPAEDFDEPHAALDDDDMENCLQGAFDDMPHSQDAVNETQASIQEIYTSVFRGVWGGWWSGVWGRLPGGFGIWGLDLEKN